MKTPKVSIIVPVYNCEQYIDQCISSLSNQSYQDFEVIIVNDGSTDNSLEICERWSQDDSRMKIVTIPNGGVSNARNVGLRNAVGEYVLFIDGDDMIQQDMLKCMIEHSNPKAIVAVGFRRFHEDEYECGVNDSIDELQVLERKCRGIAQCRQGYYCWGILYNKMIIDKYKITFCKEMKNLEDVVWNATYFMYVDRMVYIDFPFYKYRGNPTSITSKCVDPLWQAKWQYLAYRAICSDYQNRSDKVFRKASLKIRDTCIKAMCGEILSHKYCLKDFGDYMQRECAMKIEKKSSVQLQYWMLCVANRLKQHK